MMCFLSMAAYASPSEFCCPAPPMVGSPAEDEAEWLGTKETVAASMLGFSESWAGRWGMPGDERQDGTPLVDVREVAGYPALFGRRFEQRELVGAQYVLYQRRRFASNEFIDHFRHVKEALTRTYGAPRHDDTFWLDDLYRPVPGFWDVAVDLGHLVYSASWTTPTTCLALTLQGGTHTKLVLDVSRRTTVCAGHPVL